MSKLYSVFWDRQAKKHYIAEGHAIDIDGESLVVTRVAAYGTYASCSKDGRRWCVMPLSENWRVTIEGAVDRKLQALRDHWDDKMSKLRNPNTVLGIRRRSIEDVESLLSSTEVSTSGANVETGRTSEVGTPKASNKAGHTSEEARPVPQAETAGTYAG